MNLNWRKGLDLEYFCPKCKKNIPHALSHVAEEHEPSTSHTSSTNVSKSTRNPQGKTSESQQHTYKLQLLRHYIWEMKTVLLLMLDAVVINIRKGSCWIYKYQLNIHVLQF